MRAPLGMNIRGGKIGEWWENWYFLSGCPYLLDRGCEVFRPSKPHAQRISRLGRQSLHESGTLQSVGTAHSTYIVRMVGLDKVPVGLPFNEVGGRAAVPS